jgi:hypothetical protein
MKCRRVYYLGVLGPASNGQCEITDLCKARFGQPRPGQKVFIVTCQTRNGWKARDSVTSAIVPPPSPSAKLYVAAETKVAMPESAVTPESQAAPVQDFPSVSRSVYKGSTPDAQREHKGLDREHPWSILCAPLVHGVRMALWRLRMAGIKAVGI